MAIKRAKFKGIVHFEINFWYVLAYLKGIQDVGVFVYKVFKIFKFLGQTVLVCHIMQVYGHHLKGRCMHREVQIKHD